MSPVSDSAVEVASLKISHLERRKDVSGVGPTRSSVQSGFALEVPLLTKRATGVGAGGRVGGGGEQRGFGGWETADPLRAMAAVRA